MTILLSVIRKAKLKITLIIIIFIRVNYHQHYYIIILSRYKSCFVLLLLFFARNLKIIFLYYLLCLFSILPNNSLAFFFN